MRRLLVSLSVLLLALALLPSGFTAAGGPPATFTTVNTGVDGTGHCKNGPADAEDIVNCNIYDGKEYVWLNGGPSNAALADGIYFFAVLVPGGQPDPNDGGVKNLSDETALPDGTPGDGDDRANRTFSSAGGTIAYAGTHDFNSNMIRLMPYDDTTNNGGVYILAICKLSSADAEVDPKNCKYDAFKVQEADAPVLVQAVFAGTKYLDANANGQMDPGESGLANWTITITDGTTTTPETTDASGGWSFTTPAVVEGSGPATYTITETQQSGYAQTGNTVDQSSVTGGVTVALASMSYTVTVANDGIGSASGLNFGNIPLASALTAEKTATPNFTRTYAWDVAKDVDKTNINIADGASATFIYTVTVTRTGSTDSGWNVTGNITVTNPNAAAATVNVTDALPGATCVVTGGSAATIPASGSATLPYTCTYAAAPPTTEQTNTATVSWARQTLSNTTLLTAGSATAEAKFTFGDPTTIVDGSVEVTDTLGGNLGSMSYTDTSPKTFTYSHTFNGDPGGTCTKHDNTATITTNTTQTTDTASQQVTVCVGKDLTVAKTVVPTFTRTYGWTITKSVDKTTVSALNGNATFNYTVVASQTGFIDSAWAATGTITVTNPNDWQAITATVTDSAAGGTCAVVDGANVSIPASGSVTLTYSCSFTSGAGTTNTATAAWDKDTAATPTGSASGSQAVAFTTPTTRTDESITVTDTFDGVTTTLGSLNATDAQPFATQTFTYSHTVAIPAHDCISYTNTAVFTTNDTQTTGSATLTVTVCRIPPQTGARTIGFWQNKNGQGIITGGSSSIGICNSGTWLRQYAPFQDLSAAATCTQVATYVTNIIKAASSSGDSMNPMLKAQMLATALDVYFSDGALGGNPLAAPSPIGARNIDLINVCATTGSCTTYEDVSSAFGGATSMTVSAMLTYASSQSNLGGVMWYANVKSVQELAKDAFDAINNQVAFQAP